MPWKLWKKLGWQINYEKSRLIESTKCQFIGFNVFSEGPNGPWIKVLPKKLHKLKCHIQVALSFKMGYSTVSCQDQRRVRSNDESSLARKVIIAKFVPYVILQIIMGFSSRSKRGQASKI